MMKKKKILKNVKEAEKLAREAERNLYDIRMKLAKEVAEVEE